MPKLNKFFNRIKTNYEFRTFIIAAISIAVSFGFAVFNTVLAFLYNASWNSGIAIYYYLLAAGRVIVCLCEGKWHRLNLQEEVKESKRKNLYFVHSLALLILDAALVAPITLMVLERKEVNYSTVVAIGMAAFTTYKIVMASRGFLKTRRQYNLGTKILKNLTFVEALVSVLVLQYTLVMTFGEGMQGDVFVLCCATSFAIWAAVIAVSAITLFHSVKMRFANK